LHDFYWYSDHWFDLFCNAIFESTFKTVAIPNK
jgi:hypothetical protein